jgi:hypothetical protein
MNNYQSKWERRSSIRTSPRKEIDFTKNGYFYPPEKQPLLLLKEVLDLGDVVKEKILIHSFYKYLDGIISLELNTLISACNKIISGCFPFDYPEDFKLNAYTVIIDEYYHVYIARDMILQMHMQIPELDGVKYPKSDAINSVEQIKKRMDIKYHDIFEIIAVCIFETTLVRELVEFFNANDVHDSIKYYVNDHMNDEAKHYGYFYDVLIYTWNNLSAEYRDEIGRYLGDFIHLYLNVNSEKEFNRVLLQSIINDKNKTDILIDKLYGNFSIVADIPIVKNVLDVLNKAHILENPNVKNSLIKIGLM